MEIWKSWKKGSVVTGTPSNTSRFFAKPVLLSPSHSLALMAFDGLFGIQSQSIVNGGSPGEFPQGSSPKGVPPSRSITFHVRRRGASIEKIDRVNLGERSRSSAKSPKSHTNLSINSIVSFK